MMKIKTEKLFRYTKKQFVGLITKCSNRNLVFSGSQKTSIRKFACRYVLCCNVYLPKLPNTSNSIDFSRSNYFFTLKTPCLTSSTKALLSNFYLRKLFDYFVIYSPQNHLDSLEISKNFQCQKIFWLLKLFPTLSITHWVCWIRVSVDGFWLGKSSLIFTTSVLLRLSWNSDKPNVPKLASRNGESWFGNSSFPEAPFWFFSLWSELTGLCLPKFILWIYFDFGCWRWNAEIPEKQRTSLSTYISR